MRRHDCCPTLQRAESVCAPLDRLSGDPSVQGHERTPPGRSVCACRVLGGLMGAGMGAGTYSCPSGGLAFDRQPICLTAAH